jgi:hypothetical protein
MRIACFPFALIAFFAAGCAADATDSDADLFEDAPRAGAEDWSVGASTANRSWNSGETNNLSGWLNVKCDVEHGTDTLLTGINAYKENTGNLDNFIGKMGGVCGEYDLSDDDLPQTGTTWTKNIFTSTHYRAGAFGVDIPSSDAYPIGLELRVNSADGYVKDTRIKYAHKTSSGLAITSSSPSLTSWATGYSGSSVSLTCGDQEVMTGLQLKYDTDKGKIRRLEIFCRTLSFI